MIAHHVIEMGGLRMGMCPEVPAGMQALINKKGVPIEVCRIGTQFTLSGWCVVLNPMDYEAVKVSSARAIERKIPNRHARRAYTNVSRTGSRIIT